MSDDTPVPTPPRVFISYSHGSEAHRERVLALSERLRADGIDADLDQYVNGTPSEKWPRWMLNRLDWADFVLLICTPTYYRRFRGHEEPGKGKGVDWEGAIITDAIYDARSATLKFVPVLFDSADEDAIPEPVRGHTFYCLSTETDYQRLYDFLLGQSCVEPRPLGQLKLKARERAAPLTFPPTEGKSTEETARTPARLWPDGTSATATVEGTKCYARLYTICTRGEIPHAQERRGLWQAVRKDRPSSFLAWLACEWRQETGQAPPRAAFLRQGSLTLLLDGLNEIPRDSDTAYRERVAEWRDLVDAVDRSYPGVQLLFACRPLDYSERLDAGRHTRLPEVEVQPMEPARIRAFIDKRFPRPIAEQVWAQLEDGPALTLYSSPYTLNLLLGQIDPAAAEIQIPQDCAALFSGLVRARLRRECHKGSARCAAPDLLGERDRVVLLSGKPGPHWLPDDTPFFAALAALAFAIQDASGSNERWGSLPWSKARQAMAKALEERPDTDAYLHAGCDLGLFEDESAQAGDIRFVHQQIQEYFAAWALAESPDPQKLAVPWMSVELARSTERLLAAGGDDDLPELPTTGWEESALMAASLSERPDAFIRGLVPANLALAGRCRTSCAAC